MDTTNIVTQLGMAGAILFLGYRELLRFLERRNGHHDETSLRNSIEDIVIKNLKLILEPQTRSLEKLVQTNTEIARGIEELVEISRLGRYKSGN